MFGKWLWSVAPLALMIGGGAHAQAVDAGPQPARDEVADIVVTALKKSESVQSTAATVTVVDQTRIAIAAVSNLIDIAKVVPALNTSVSPDAYQFVATMRGLGSQPGNPSFDASVATYINGAFLARDRELSVSLFDVATIEAISGTQAALLGKNSSLGAINVVTVKPGDDLGFSGRYEHEFELDSDRIEAGVDLPLSDMLKLRAAGFYETRGGPLREVISGEKQRDRTGGGRVTAVWTPSDRLDVTLMGQIVSGRTSGPNTQQIVLAGTEPETLAAALGFPGVITTEYGKSAQFSPTLGYTRRGTLNARLGVMTINYDIGDGTLTSQSGYSRSRANLTQNSTYLPGDALLAYIPDSSRQFTQELRYAASIGSSFDYIAGLFYLKGHYRQVQTQAANYPFGTTPIPFPVTGASATNFKQTNEAVSGFAQGNYHISDPLTFTLGLRYTREKKSADLSRDIVVPGTYSLFLSPPVAPFTLSNVTKSLDGSVGLNYKPSSNVLFYATFGQGTKPGGYATAVGDLTRAYYKPERARTAELGFKTQLFDRALTLNGSYFRTRVRNFQVVNFDGQNFVVFNQNVASDGFESQVNWRATSDLRFYWNNIYSDARDARTGVRIPYAPRWSGLIGGTLEHDLTANLRAELDVNVDYRSKVISLTEVKNVPYLTPPLAALHRLNVSIGVGDEGKGWNVRLIGQNLTNQHVYGFAFPIPFLGAPAGQQSAVGVPLNPRTIKLQLGIKM